MRLFSVRWLLFSLYAGGLCLTAGAEHDNGVKPPPLDPKVPKAPAAPRVPLAKPCFHAQLMKAHYNLMVSDEAEKESLQKGPTELKFVKASEAATSRLVEYASDDGCDVVFAFRGTKNEGDVWTDLDANVDSTGKYHQGFLTTAQAYKADVLLALQKNKCGDTGGPRITFSGHSMGGAVADALANVVLRNLLPATTDVVVFGSPRLVLSNALTSGKHADRFPVDHYYIDQDPVPTVPESPPFTDLTSLNHRFAAVALSKEGDSVGNSLIQNHTPANYKEKMDRLCEGKEATTAVKTITHNVADATLQMLRKAVIESQKAVKDFALTEADTQFYRVFPKKNSEGQELPGPKQTVEILETAMRLQPQRGKAAAWNEGDGDRFAKKLACEKWGWSLSETQRGINHFCNSLRTGFLAEKVDEACGGRCGATNYQPGTCFKGCADTIHNFCVGKWSCKN